MNGKMAKSLRHDFTEVRLRVRREGETVVLGETEVVMA
jgi:hypothetical protein